MTTQKRKKVRVDMKREEARASSLAVGALLLVSLLYAATII